MTQRRRDRDLGNQGGLLFWRIHVTAAIELAATAASVKGTRRLVRSGMPEPADARTKKGVLPLVARIAMGLDTRRRCKRMSFKLQTKIILALYGSIKQYT